MPRRLREYIDFSWRWHTIFLWLSAVALASFASLSFIPAHADEDAGGGGGIEITSPVSPPDRDEPIPEPSQTAPPLFIEAPPQAPVVQPSLAGVVVLQGAGVQLSDNPGRRNSGCGPQIGPIASAVSGGDWSPYVSDGSTDFNCARVNIAGRIAAIQETRGSDFRVCIQLNDNNRTQEGPEACTPWASEGGGGSGWAHDGGVNPPRYDPDEIRIRLDTRPLTGGTITIEQGSSQLVDTQTILSGLRNLYAPSVLDVGVKRMWLGGWLTDDDPNRFLESVRNREDLGQVFGADKIYRSDFAGGAWTRPLLTFQKRGFHVNDPSVVRASSGLLLMYYTALANADARDQRFDRHAVGLAVSTDGGVSWIDRDIVIGQNNGLDSTGAWSPGAIAVGNQVWVYYHTSEAGPKILRTVFDANGSGVLRTERVSIPSEFSPDLFSNVDVFRQGSRFVLVANTTDLRRIARYISDDGLRFVKDPEDSSPIINGGSAFVLTPHGEVIDADRYRVYFGFDSGSGSHEIRVAEFVKMPALTSSAGGIIITDARLGVQLIDRGCADFRTVGATQYTPWISGGGGWSAFQGDSNAYDPDCLQVYLEVKTAPAPVEPIPVTGGQAPDGRAPSGTAPPDGVPPPAVLTETNDSACVSLAAPDSVQPGQQFRAVARMRNTGTSIWTNLYHLRDVFNRWGVGNVPISGFTRPGEETGFVFTATAPAEEENYSFSWQMGPQEGAQGFGEWCSKAIIVARSVVSPQPPSPPSVQSPLQVLQPPSPPSVQRSQIQTLFCSASGDVVRADAVRWNVECSGVPGPYRYSWSGTDVLSGSTKSIEKTYATTGTKEAFVTVIVLATGETVTARAIAYVWPPEGIIVSPYCENNASRATIAWRTAGENDRDGFYVDIDIDGNWGNGFWNRFVPAGTYSAIAPGGFAPVFGAVGALEFRPGAAYSARVYYIRPREHTPTAAFQAFDCLSPPPVANQLPKGSHDGNDSGACMVNGWAADPDASSERIAVRIYSDGQFVGEAAADQFRPDLISECAGGVCAFSASLAGRITPEVLHTIRVRGIDAQTGEEQNLENTPRTLACSADVLPPEPPPGIEPPGGSPPSGGEPRPGGSGALGGPGPDDEISVIASPPRIANPREPVVLIWSVPEATSCVLEPEGRPVPISCGGQSPNSCTVAPERTTTYELSCDTPAGPRRGSARVIVSRPPPKFQETSPATQ